jgi:hypothetical protein
MNHTGLPILFRKSKDKEPLDSFFRNPLSLENLKISGISYDPEFVARSLPIHGESVDAMLNVLYSNSKRVSVSLDGKYLPSFPSLFIPSSAFRHSAILPFRHSVIPLFRHSRHSAIPPFRYSRHSIITPFCPSALSFCPLLFCPFLLPAFPPPLHFS